MRRAGARRRSTATDGGVSFAPKSAEIEEPDAPLARKRTDLEELDFVAEELLLKKAAADKAAMASNVDSRSVSSFQSAKPVSRNRKGAVYIVKPRAMPGSSYITVFLTLLHYFILAFLFMGGSFYNENNPPFLLFLIPSFVVGSLTVVGVMCLVLQGNPLVRKLCEPSTGLKMSILGVFGCGAFSMVVWAPLKNDYSQAILMFEIGGGMVVYYLLVRRRLNFASIAFAQGAKAVSRLKALWFRVALHGFVLLVYSVGWSIVYLQLIRMEYDDGTETTAGGNSTQGTGNEPDVELAGLKPGASLLPAFISSQIRQGTVRYAARGWLVYNLLVVSQFIKGSVWLSVAASAASISEAAQNGTPARMCTSSQMNTKLRESLPSLAVSGHVSLIVAIFRMVCEGLRRFPKKRSGLIYTSGSLLYIATRPLVSRMNLVGLCDMGTSKRNIVTASKYVWQELEVIGMHTIVNDDVIFGARLCSSILFAAVSNLTCRLLVEIFQFPEQISEELGNMCFVMSFLIGNLGIEAGEAWSVSLHLQFARRPEAIYVANPPFADALHSILFGLKIGRKSKKKSEDVRRTVESPDQTCIEGTDAGYRQNADGFGVGFNQDAHGSSRSNSRQESAKSLKSR